MASKPKFLTQRFGAYFHRDVPRENEELTHVGPGTPGGEYLRRFWQPVALSSELKDLPLRKRVMGEDLVLFRDLSGRVGLLELHCSHRGTSLEFGIPSERGLRCCYHAWLYDIDGRILETPGEPPGSTLKDRLCHGAYPTHEYKGLVFAYMGPPDKRPEFPIYDTFELPGNRMVPFSLTWPCNWVQITDNAMDPVHTVALHTEVSTVQFSEAFGEMPEFDWRETPIGMIYIATRRVGDRVWVRSSDFMVANMSQAGAIWEDGAEEKIFTRAGLTRWTVPIDDTHTLLIGWRYFNKGVDPHNIGKEEELGKDRVDFFGQTGDKPYDERQRSPGDYDAQVAQRPIAIHDLEHLTSIDRGVIMFRGLVSRGIRAVKNGKDPHRVVRKVGGVIPTYVHDTIVRLPVLQNDRELLKEIGRKVTEIVVDGEHHARDDREARIQELVWQLVSSTTKRKKHAARRA